MGLTNRLDINNSALFTVIKPAKIGVLVAMGGHFRIIADEKKHIRKSL